MTLQLTDKELRIQKLAQNFTNSILNNESETYKCFSICYPLSIHFKNEEIENSIIIGHYKGKEHYWLILDDSETIVDPSLGQFEINWLGQVFIGKNFNNAYKPQENSNFDKSIESWKQPFIDNPKYKSSLPREFEKTFLTIILTAATLLYVESEKAISKSNSELLKMRKIYFAHIREIILADKNVELINDLELILPKEFKRLLNWIYDTR